MFNYDLDFIIAIISFITTITSITAIPKSYF